MDKSKLMGVLIGGAITAVIGGLLTYFNTKESIAMQVVFDQKAIAYAQFIDHRIQRNQLTKVADYKTNPDYLNSVANTRSAIFKIAVFGDAPVVHSLAKQFSSEGEEYNSARIDLLNAMRESLGSDRVDTDIMVNFLGLKASKNTSD